MSRHVAVSSESWEIQTPGSPGWRWHRKPYRTDGYAATTWLLWKSLEQPERPEAGKHKILQADCMMCLCNTAVLDRSICSNLLVLSCVQSTSIFSQLHTCRIQKGTCRKNVVSGIHHWKTLACKQEVSTLNPQCLFELWTDHVPFRWSLLA